MEPSDRNSSRPFDERDDEMSVRKGLLFFSQDKAAEAVQVLSRESSLSRSSLLSLNVPFVEDIDDADDDDNVTYRVKDNIRIQDGCYLLYDAASGGTLVLHYSHERVPENAVGFWTPAPNAKLQEFKFRRAGGYTELVRGIIGGEKNKRQYLSGWCQFVQMAKSWKGSVQKFPNPAQGMNVDIYGFVAGYVRDLDMDDCLVNVSDLEAVVVVRKDNDRFVGVQKLTELAFLELGNIEGASLKLHD